MISLRDGDEIRLQNHNGRYLHADEGFVFLKADGSTPNVRWTVEKAGTRFRLKSCYGKYLTMVYHDGIAVSSRMLNNHSQQQEWMAYHKPLTSWRVQFTYHKPSTSCTQSKVETEEHFLLLSCSGSYGLQAEDDKYVKTVSINRLRSYHFPPQALWKVEVVEYVVPQFSPERCPFNDEPPTNFESPVPSVSNQMLFSSAPVNFVKNYYFSGRDSIYSNSGHNTNLSGTQSNGYVDAHNYLQRHEKHLA